MLRFSYVSYVGSKEKEKRVKTARADHIHPYTFLLVATGSAYEGAERQGHPHDRGHNNDFGGHQYDWLNPGGVTHYYNGWNSYSWYYPTYTYSW